MNLYPRVHVKCRCGCGAFIVRPPSPKRRKAAKRPGATQKGDWTWPSVVAALHERGISLQKLGAKAGLTAHNRGQNALHNVGQKTYLNGERIIAEALGLKPSDIWPSRYSGPRRNARSSRRCGLK